MHVFCDRLFLRVPRDRARSGEGRRGPARGVRLPVHGGAIRAGTHTEYSAVMLRPGKALVPNSQIKRARFLSLFTKSQISWSQTVNKIYQNLEPNSK